MWLISAGLSLSYLLDLIKCLQKAFLLVVVKWIRSPRDLAPGLIVVTSMNRAILRLADAVAVANEALETATVDHFQLSIVLNCRCIFIF